MSTAQPNYCRQIAISAKAMASAASVALPQQKEAAILLDLCMSAKKFALPFNGVVFLDPDLRALDGDMELRLPAECIALEFRCFIEGVETKRVIFAREVQDSHERGILITPIAWLPELNAWATKDSVWMPVTGYLDRSTPGETGFYAITLGKKNEPEKGTENDLSTLLGFLNALACSNVHIEGQPPKKLGKKIKASLPFDTYHVLTIDVGRQHTDQKNGDRVQGRHPREHLRRGHIRRLSDGRRIWVNATVVAASSSGGAVHKDYLVRTWRPAA